jgi:hypothetical protein
LLAAAVCVWGVVVGLGLFAVFEHDTTSGEIARSPARWPSGTRLPRGRGVTVAMFVYPGCPCTRASLGELAQIAFDADAAIDIVVTGPATPWGGAQPSGARWIADDGREAARFGAHTSGYTVVYDAAGVLQFAGGVTGSRGHVGDNVGRDAVQRIARGQDPEIHDHGVFGCALGGAR